MDQLLQIPGCKLIHLQQRSKEWHSWRNGEDLPDGKPRVTGTAATIIAGDSVTDTTQHQLWMEWTGRKVREEPSEFLRKLFDHGVRMEVVARAAYEKFTGNTVHEVCVQHPDHPWAGASLDGLTATGDIVAELKCPVSQRIHTMAKRKTVPSYYYAQVQWELLCTPTAIEAHYYSYFESDEEGVTGALVVVQRDEAMMEKLLRQALDFRLCVIEDRPPANVDWLLAAKAYRQAKIDADEANTRLEAATKNLSEMLPAERDSFDGGGVMATRYYVKQSVDWQSGFKELGFSEDQIGEAEASCREPGPVDYVKVLADSGIDQSAADTLCEKHRAAGPVDYKKVGSLLGLSKESLKTLESKHKKGGDVRYRVTVTSDYVPIVLPSSDGAAPAADGNRIVLPEKDDSSADQTWSGW